MANHAESVASGLRFRPFRPADARTMMSWRYPSPYSVYDLDPQDTKVLAALLRPENNYHAILRGGEMVGFFCLGPDARVGGGTYDESSFDLGMGLRPDLTTRGQGQFYFDKLLAYLEEQSPGRALRTTIVAWNLRAIRLCQRAGFRVLAHFTSQSEDKQEYVVLLRPAQHR